MISNKDDQVEGNNKKSNEKNKTSTQQGFPEIADTQHRSTKLFLIVAVIVGLGVFGFYQGHKASHKSDDSNESFHVDSGPAPLIITNNAKSQQANNKPSGNNNDSTNATNIADAQKAILARIQSPIMMTGNQAQSTNTSLSQVNMNNRNNDASTVADPNTQFMNQVSNQDVDTSEATLLQHRDTLIAQGNLIHAVLESAINSDLPGFLRAIVSEPVYSEDGSQILIPQGSRLIGQYKSDMLTGQSRVFVVWTRVIEPNGISVQLGSPGIDSLGDAGQGADSIDYHFWQMFGTATLLSVLGAGASNVGVSDATQNNASQTYRQAMTNSLAQTAQNSLQQNTMIPPTLHINQGTPIMVFVARDLRFNVLSKRLYNQNNIF